jgi:probable HAF family extracellular repeat protein
VTGWAQDGTGTFAFVSRGDGKPMKRIYNRWGGTNIRANAVNDSGQVTGSAQIASPEDISNAFVWTGDGTPMLDLRNHEVLGRIYSAGAAINASGQVAGYAGDNGRSIYAFVWKNDGTPVIELAGLGGYRTSPCCINASGQVAGSSSVSGFAQHHAFLWSNGRMRDLGTLARGSLSEANALNDSGQVAGSATTSFWSRQHAFVWLNDGTPMKDLGTFGGTTSGASDINASGQVTGYAHLAGDTESHAFLWRNDGTVKKDVNALIDPLDPLKRYVTLTEGRYINDRGNILAFGTDNRTGVSSPYFLQGTVITLSPRSLAFGNQPVNSISAAKWVTVTNTSPKPVAITSIALAGIDPGHFAATNNCSRTLAGHAKCTIAVKFKPGSRGAKAAVLNVNGGGGGLRSVKLTGTGI